MIIDRYTKAVLTVIAGCLLWQCIISGARPVEAQQLSAAPSVPQRVIIVGWGERATPIPVEINAPVRLAYAPDSPLPVGISAPVRLAYMPDNPLPVGVTAISRVTEQWDAIRTQVQPQPRQRMPGE